MKYESDFQSDILKDLRSYGKYCECFKIMSASDLGVPDVFFTTSKTGCVFIEVKREKDGKPSPAQILKNEKLNRCGCKAFFCYTWAEWVEIKKTIGLNKTDVISAASL